MCKVPSGSSFPLRVKAVLTTALPQGMTSFCSSSTFRLVSSGRFDNSVTVRARAASESDIDFNSLMVMCPDFMGA